MNALRNPELRRLLTIGLPLAVITTVAAFLIAPAAGILAAAASAAGLIALILLTLRWLRDMSRLTDYVEQALTGRTVLDISQNREGEMSILAGEIYKLASAIRYQLDVETELRVHLADSLANVSHQLKTPLTTLGIVAELLAKPSLSDEDRLKQARETRACVNRMDSLTQALLKLARLDAGVIRFRPEPLLADALIGDALRPLEIALELRGVNIEHETNPDAHLTADPFWTTEALGNILKNAMEHTNEGGTIRIRAMETPLFGRIDVENNGAGIADADMGHIFERFYKGKNASPDSIGIGLALARQICHSQNGSITAKNIPGGCRFTIEFRKKVL